jgi:hypothetical protein
MLEKKDSVIKPAVSTVPLLGFLIRYNLLQDNVVNEYRSKHEGEKSRVEWEKIIKVSKLCNQEPGHIKG